MIIDMYFTNSIIFFVFNSIGVLRSYKEIENLFVEPPSTC